LRFASFPSADRPVTTHRSEPCGPLPAAFPEALHTLRWLPLQAGRAGVTTSLVPPCCYRESRFPPSSDDVAAISLMWFLLLSDQLRGLARAGVRCHDRRVAPPAVLVPSLGFSSPSKVSRLPLPLTPRSEASPGQGRGIASSLSRALLLCLRSPWHFTVSSRGRRGCAGVCPAWIHVVIAGAVRYPKMPSRGLAGGCPRRPS